MVAFLARVKVENRGAQAQGWKQPRLEIMELSSAGSGSSNIKPPRLNRVLVDGPDNPFGIGVGPGD